MKNCFNQIDLWDWKMTRGGWDPYKRAEGNPIGNYLEYLGKFTPPFKGFLGCKKAA